MRQATQELDIRAVPHSERLSAILGHWQGLPNGETLRLVVDHNPLPLQFLLRGESPGQFYWEYEKEGPDEWVVRVTRVAEARTLVADGSAGQDEQALKNLLVRLHAGADVAAVKEEAKGLLRTMDATKLAMLEQGLIREGLGREEMRRLCDVHLEIMRENLGEEHVTPEPGHPIHTLMEEHKVLLRNLEELDGYLAAAREAGSVQEISRELAGVRGVVHHLLEAERHHQREEQVIFPALESRGVTEPPQIMREEHVELRAKKHALAELCDNASRHAYRDWVRGLEDTAGYLVREMGNHIYKEDNVLYQVALQTIEPEAWGDIKERCDRIGYCCFTPGQH